MVFPIFLFILRLFVKEPEASTKNSMRYAKTPYMLSFKMYGWRLFIVSLIWFIYDVS